MPEKEWFEKYEKVKSRLDCKVDLEAYFSQKQIGGVGVDTFGIGAVHFPTGQVVACDPLVSLGDELLPYLQTVPAGTYPVTVCVAPSETYGDRYACVKVEVTAEKPVRYELGMTGTENLDKVIDSPDKDVFFGFFVDAGMGCITDLETNREFGKYWEKRAAEDPSANPYDDLFSDLLADSCREHPEYQRDGGDWANWTIPGTSCNVPLFASGWGDGVYPCYFAYDASGAVCAVYVHLIDIAAEYDEA
ncbi:MAG: DUF4241 domain-containing protein [Subdoligranulum sp.]|nr:DUF4241 domain-containing protein [Subdoligranulum sp.]